LAARIAAPPVNWAAEIRTTVRRLGTVLLCVLAFYMLILGMSSKRTDRADRLEEAGRDWQELVRQSRKQGKD
jgi:hypothetical protein